MKSAVLLGLALLGCGGGQAEQQGGPGPPPGAAAGQAGQSPTSTAGGSKNAAQAGETGEAAEPSGGEAQGGQEAAGSAGAAQAGAGGQASAGAGQGGQADAGQGGQSEAGQAGTGGGGQPPADDTGCIARPVSTASGAQVQVRGLDCSECSNGAELGYTVPSFCENGATCVGNIEVAALGGNDVFMLLPAASEVPAICRQPFNCKNEQGQPADTTGLYRQILIKTSGSARLDVDENRRVLDINRLDYCDELRTCDAVGSPRLFAIMVKVGAPRGWLRVRVNPVWNCSYQPYPTG